MSRAMFAELPDRGVVRIAGADAAKLLQGLITNDMDRISGGAGAMHAGLLSPQGKILFEFFVIADEDGFLLDVARSKAGELVQRLTLYRLRADVAISDASGVIRTYAAWGNGEEWHGSKSFIDPRSPELGRRIFVDETLARAADCAPLPDVSPTREYHAHRISVGAPEGGKDYPFGDAFPHEANFDVFDGVSFTKGCYVGQEVVARMQNKSVVRKRVVRITGAAPLTAGQDVLLGEAPIGRVGSACGANALALLRLDRVVEALEKSIPLVSGGIEISPEAKALDRYRASVTRHASSGLPP
ncbi:MAG: CAF17-like 4Fe-4S cluster assembly/insertion protein YgfZ [Hyphomicrobium sp.]